MALSNMLREPRRELTESAIGILTLGLFLIVDYFLAVGLNQITGGPRRGCPVILGMAVFVPGILFIVLAGGLVFTHYLGEVICGLLARNGLELRPKVRPNGR